MSSRPSIDIILLEEKEQCGFKTFISCGSEKNVCQRQSPHNKDPSVFVLIKDVLLEKREAEGGLFKLYRADVELSCPRTPSPTSDGQWEECPAAGSIMHFQHLKTMSVRSTTPSPKNGRLQPKSYSAFPRLILSAVFLINICVAILVSSHFRYPCCVLSYGSL